MDYVTLIQILTCIIVIVLSSLHYAKKKGYDTLSVLISACATLILLFYSQEREREVEREMQNQIDSLISNIERTNRDNLKKTEEVVASANRTKPAVREDNSSIGNSGNHIGSVKTEGGGDAMINQGQNGKVIKSGDRSIILTDIRGSKIQIGQDEEPVFAKVINVSKMNATDIPVKKGDRISLAAYRSIKAGDWVGPSTPDGRTEGVLGFPIDQYSKVRDFPHAALMYKLSESDDWDLCGSSRNFVAEKDGKLIFEVNDDDQGNNSGYYAVQVKIYRD